MKKTLNLLLILILLAPPSLAHANIDIINKYVQSPQKVGGDRFAFMMWDIYDASLYGSDGQYKKDQTFALKLDYLRKLDGIKIAERSAEEIEKQGYANQIKLDIWLDQMKKIFPDVTKGDSIIGIKNDKDQTIFYLNGKQIGKINDPEFTEKFFDIWLSPKTSEPELRNKLLGMAK